MTSPRGVTPPAADPRAVFALAGFLGVGAVAVRDAAGLLPFLAVALVSAVCMRVEPRRVLFKLRRLLSMLAAVAVLQGLFQPEGRILFRVAGFSLVTTGGLLTSAEVLERLAVLILGGSMLSRFSSRVVVQGLVQLRLPYELAYMVSVGIRFIPSLSEGLRDALTAVQLRGVDFDRLGWRERMRVYVYLLLPSVAGCLYTAGQLAQSMETRGFRAFPTRTSYFTLRFSRRDYLLLGLVGLLAMLSIVFYIVLPYVSAG